MASSSSSSLPPRPHWDYDVFVSFRGEDTRKTFVSHLFNALEYKGLEFFRDDVSLERGKSISPELLKAIKSSRYAVIVFSKNYGSSSWCLEELVAIMQCRKESGQIVLPVFYDVEPCDVRKGRILSRNYGFSPWFCCSFLQELWFFVQRRGIVDKHTEREEVWRATLVEAANIAGLEPKNIANGHEAAFIKELVQKIASDVNHRTPCEDENLVGMRTRVEELLRKLDTNSDDVLMFGIYGMGGAGKTTVARAVYDAISHHFDGISFVESLRHKGIEHALQKVLSDLLKDKDFKVGGVMEGKKMMKERLRGRRLLIVLDDVDNADQMQSLAGDHSWFGKGSKIIITARDKQILRASRVDKWHQIQLLNKHNATQLFCRFAFKSNVPPKEFEKLSNDVVRYADGLPLALRVLGSLLCGEEVEEWRNTLARLKDLPEKGIDDVLKISYDSLQEIHKQTFLDIACLFRGWKKDEVMDILDACEIHHKEGVKVLVQRSLITISDGAFVMHDLIHEMARHIVQWKHPHEPEKHSRVWEIEKLVQLFSGDTQEVKGKAVEALVGSFSEHNVNFTVSIKMKKLRLIHFVLCVDCHGTPTSLPSGLRWITWHNYPGDMLPTTFQAQNLVCLDLSKSNIVQLWKGYKSLPNLKILNLSWCARLIQTPDFRGTPNLTTLDLTCCIALVEIHDSVGYLKKLISLKLSYCMRLVSFPPLVEMNSLEIFSLWYCKGIREFPEVKGNLDRLRDLNLSFSKLGGPLFLWNSNHLEKLHLSPHVSRLSYLRILHLGGCNLYDGDIPSDIDTLSRLEVLELLGNEFSSLPNSLSKLSRLRYLGLSLCRRLEVLPELPYNLHILDAERCESLTSIADIITSEWLWRASFWRSTKLLQNENFIREADLLLQSMLKGASLDDFHLSVIFPGTPEQWRPLIGGAARGNKFLLQLPPNWFEDFCGLSMYVSGSSRGHSGIDITVRPLSEHKGASPDSLTEYSQDVTIPHLHMWFGYIPFSCLPLSASHKASNYFLITFLIEDIPAEICGVKLVQKKYPKPVTAPSYSRPHTYPKLIPDCYDPSEIKFCIQTWVSRSH